MAGEGGIQLVCMGVFYTVDVYNGNLVMASLLSQTPPPSSKLQQFSNHRRPRRFRCFFLTDADPKKGVQKQRIPSDIMQWGIESDACRYM